MKSFHLLLLVSGFFLSAIPSAGQPDYKPHTAIELIAGVASAQAGDSFLVGLRMTMDPGWHTYWKNPGEAGLSTTISWTLPQGISAGEILWPAPHKYTEGGEVITFGYEHENMLIIPVAVSPSFSSDRIVFNAEVEWLECEQLCLPASGSVSLTLPVSGAKAAGANKELFERYLSRLPAPYRPGGDLTVSTTLDHEGLLVSVRPGQITPLGADPEHRPDFFPDPSDLLAMDRTTVSVSGDETLLRVPISLYERGKAPSSIGGIVVYAVTPSETRSIALTIPVSAEQASRWKVTGEERAPDKGILDREFIIGDGNGQDEPLILYLFFAFVGGMLLNIMPCVLPVIGLKVFGLVRMGGEDPRRVRKLGWLFSAGIVASFLTLALMVIVLKAAGEQVGWGFQFQEPLFVIIMSAVVMAFGLSLFGVFEVQLPASATIGLSGLVTKVGEQGNSGLGSFGEGVFATVLATPCTAPILGTALGFAFAQPATIILLMFFTVAAGMAFPYLILTLRPAWMKVLPKPGEWMVTAKQFMGFLMMATLIWLLYVLGKQLGMEAVIWTGAFLLTVGIACWIVGRFATLTASRPRFALAWVMAILVLAGGWALFEQPVLEAKNLVAGTGEMESDGIRWEKFSLVSLDRHLTEGRAVFIDFTAEWCLTCKVNEKTVLAQDDVIGKFRESGIIAMKADWTSRNPDVTSLLTKFGRSGVPLYVLFPKGKPNEPLILPEVITGGIVLEAIERATNPS